MACEHCKIPTTPPYEYTYGKDTWFKDRIVVSDWMGYEGYAIACYSGKNEICTRIIKRRIDGEHSKEWYENSCCGSICQKHQ